MLLQRHSKCISICRFSATFLPIDSLCRLDSVRFVFRKISYDWILIEWYWTCFVAHCSLSAMKVNDFVTKIMLMILFDCLNINNDKKKWKINILIYQAKQIISIIIIMIIDHAFEIRSKRVDNNPNETDLSNFMFQFERIYSCFWDVERERWINWDAECFRKSPFSLMKMKTKKWQICIIVKSLIKFD